ncbi:MAG: hypothetical protein AB7U35_08340 [Sphingobium sp.]
MNLPPIDYELASPEQEAEKAFILSSGIERAQPNGVDQRLRLQRRASRDGGPDMQLSLHRLKRSFEPSRVPDDMVPGDMPTARMTDVRVSAAVRRSLNHDVAATLEWQAARITGHNGTIIADGGKGYRRKTTDYMMPQIALDAALAWQVALRLRHRESLRSNLDIAFFGPRSTSLAEWTGERDDADIERSMSDEAMLSWRAGEGGGVNAYVRHTAFHNRMMADERGLLHHLPGPSRTGGYGLSADWRVDERTRLSASAAREDFMSGLSGHRSEMSLGLERREGGRRLILSVVRQDNAYFDVGTNRHVAFRQTWAVRCFAEQRLVPSSGASRLPETTLRLEARSAPDTGLGYTDGAPSGGLASRDVQPQIRLGLSARW